MWRRERERDAASPARGRGAVPSGKAVGTAAPGVPSGKTVRTTAPGVPAGKTVGTATPAGKEAPSLDAYVVSGANSLVHCVRDL